MQLIKPRKESKAKIKGLYFSAFPQCERKPFRIFLMQQRKKLGETLEIEDSGRFIGFVITARLSDIVLLDYFAITDEMRGKGLGSKVLALLKERYSAKRLFLETEEPEITAENYEIRKRRFDFYVRNGFKPQDFSVVVYGTRFRLMQCRGEIRFEEYCEVIKRTNGVFGHVIRPSLIKP